MQQRQTHLTRDVNLSMQVMIDWAPMDASWGPQNPGTSLVNQYYYGTSLVIILAEVL